MNTLKKAHAVNKVFLGINLLLYATLILGMLFQLVLGFTQIIIAIVFTAKYNQLAKSTQKKLLIYWFLVLLAVTGIYINNLEVSKSGNLIFLFFVPMLVAIYFYFVTATANNDSFLNAYWKNLALINYEIDPKLLEKYLPKGTEIDLFNGKCYVSLVGFLFQDTKILGMKIPFHVNFEEVNLRFYVKRFENNQWKRGVVFIKEIVPKHALTLVANTVYKEHYQTLPMRNNLVLTTDTMNISYQWRLKNQWNTIKLTANNALHPIEENSEAEFICEHYFGYTKYNDKTTFEYEVKHPRWEQYQVTETQIEVDFEALYGKDFGYLKNLKPCSVILAKGSEVSVENKRTIK